MCAGYIWAANMQFPYMLAQGGGIIVNTASVAGQVGLPKRAVYSASKGAVIALTKQVAIEYVDKNIRVNLRLSRHSGNALGAAAPRR